MECVLSGLLSVEGKKVLQIDRNPYYGSESASLNLTQAWEKFSPGTNPPENYGRPQNWAFDLVPKFLMANGELTNMLVVCCPQVFTTHKKYKTEYICICIYIYITFMITRDTKHVAH